jgi:hypothetical protein
VADPVDIAALVPAVTRALEALGQTVEPPQAYDITADALASVLLYTGSVFGAKLLVTERDGDSQAPTKYATDRLLTPEETSVIRAQAAMERLGVSLGNIKTSERIADESQEWEINRSAQAIRDQLKLLIDERDRALEALERRGAALDSYESYIEATDRYISVRVEPWLYGLNGAVGGQQLDPRFA